MKKKAVEKSTILEKEPSFFQKYKLALIPMFFAIALYFNTLHHGFVLDDGLINQDTEVTGGIKNFFNFFTQKALPEVGSIKPYRPVTSISFAIDYTFLKSDDVAKMASNMHLMNVLYYGLALFFTFIFIKKLFKNNLFALSISLLFASHPLHTEVVANIKSRDEILAFLFGIIFLLFYIKYKKSNLRKYFYGSLVFYFIAILSKESALLFIGIIPFIAYYLSENKKFEFVKDVKWFLIPAIIYLVLQRIILGNNFVVNMTEIDNMLVGITNVSDNLATRIYIVGLYLYKIIVPTSLFYDYSIGAISPKTFGNFSVWIGLFSIIGLIYLTFKGIIRKNKAAFGLLFMFVMFALTCNLFISIGATFAERFAFTPILGFAIAIVYLLNEIATKFKIKRQFLLVFFVPMILFYSFKTYSRNENWKDNQTLFTHDYLENSKSIRIQNNYASALYLKAKSENDSILQRKLYLESSKVLDSVTDKYPNYVEAYIQKGINYLEIKDCEKAVFNFERAKSIGTYNFVIEQNLGVGYINCNRPNDAVKVFSKLLINDPKQEQYYLKNLSVAFYNAKIIDSSFYYLTKLKNKFPDDADVNNYLKLVTSSNKIQTTTSENITDVVTNSSVNDIAKATTEFNEAYKFYLNGNKDKAKVTLENLVIKYPNYAMNYSVLGLISDEKGNYGKAVEYYKKSIAINPNDYRIYFNMGNAYLNLKENDKAINYLEKCIKMNPTYAKPYKSLELYYKSLNDTEKATYYAQKFNELNK